MKAMTVKLSGILLICLVLLTAPQLFAQEIIELGQLKLGAIAADGSETSFIFEARAGQNIKIVLLGVTPGIAPQFAIYNENDALTQFIANPDREDEISGIVNFSRAGAYRIAVTSATDTGGQFVLNIQSGEPAVPPITLEVGEPLTGMLSSGQELVFGWNAGSVDPLRLEVMTNSDVRIEIRDAADETIADVKGSPLGNIFNIPAGQGGYTLLLSNESDTASGDFELLLSSLGEPSVVDATPVTTETEEAVPDVDSGMAVLPTGGGCVIATQGRTNVNVRSGPATAFTTIGRMQPVDIFPVTGRTLVADGTWYQIPFNGASGWVAGFVTRRGGDCNNVAVISPPPIPQPEPSLIPPPTLPAPIVEPPITPAPTIEPTIEFVSPNERCRRQFGSNAFASDGSCYRCPSNSTLSSGIMCERDQFTGPAIQHNKATGILGLDCPAGSGQFHHIGDGYCYSCPSGYTRTVFAIDGQSACEFNGDRRIGATQLGFVPGN